MVDFMFAVVNNNGMDNALERFRKTHDLSYADMAAQAGFRSRSTPYHHCNGMRRIDAESAVLYARAFGIPLSDLRPDLWPPESSGQQPYRPGDKEALASEAGA